MPREIQDSIDRHVARWSAVLSDIDPEVEGATTRIHAILRHLDRGTHARFVDIEDTIEDYKTLHALLAHHYPEEATPAQLADDCHVTRAAMTSRLDRLVELAYLTREVDPLDRRRIIVRPTQAGRAVWKQALELAVVREKQTINVLTEAEKVQLNTLLRKIMLGLDS
jgi:DNA-binding MarR family transcriptional regulator